MLGGLIRLLSALAMVVACNAYDPCEEEPGACDCLADRRLPDGTCCFGFTRPDEGVCLARTWTRPRIAEAWGDPGAHDVEVIVDSEGHGVASWIAPGQLVLAEEIDGAWVLQQPAAGLTASPSLAAGPGTEVLLAWTHTIEDVDVAYLGRRHDGEWRYPRTEETLSLPPAGREPKALLTAWGETIVVWNQQIGAQFGVALATRTADDGALTRLEPALSPAGASTDAPQIAIGPNGDALVVWLQPMIEGGDAMVYASERYRIEGGFDRPAADAFLSAPGAAAHGPMAAVGDRGHAAVVWSQEAIQLVTRDGLGAWTVPQLDRPFSMPGGDASDAHVAFGRGTELFVIWSQARALVWAENLGAVKQVWAAHRDELGTWDEPGEQPTLLSSPDAVAVSPSLAAGPHGEVIAVWAERDRSSRWRIATRRRNAGATRWSEPDVLSRDDGHDALHPAVAIGATGRALVAWEQGPPGATTIRFAAMD